MQVAGIDTIRGVETVHFVFLIDGGALWYHIHQDLESWVGRADFHSRRFVNQTEEKGKAWERKFDIYPDSGFYREAGRDSTFPTVADPLDDAAFLYWIRTVPLEKGKRYEYHRRSEEHTSELQSRLHLVCRLLLEKKNKKIASRDYM